MMVFADIDAFSAHLGTLPSAVRKAQRTVLRQFAAEVKADAQGVLGTYDNGWVGLADITKAARVKAGYPADEPLLVTGELRSSIHYVTTDTRAVIGSDSEYAAVHEEGYPKGRIPPRPYLKPAMRRVEHRFVDAMGSAVAHALAGQSPPASAPSGGGQP